MFKYSWKVLLGLLILFLLFLIKAHIDDSKVHSHHLTNNECNACKILQNPSNNMHKAIVETISYEHKYGKFAESKVKKILISSRDQIIRGILIGALEGSAITAFQGAIAWSLTGGIVTGIGDMFNWKSKF